MENILEVTRGNTILRIHDSLSEEQKMQAVLRFSRRAYRAIIEQELRKEKKDEAV